MQRMTRVYVEARRQDFQEDVEGYREQDEDEDEDEVEAESWRLEAESKALDGNNGGREVVGCVMTQLAC